MVRRLFKIYTPFICAFTALIHGVCILLEVKGLFYSIMNEFTGHSVLLIAYIICSSQKMCIWYKITNYLLLSLHIFNLSYYFDLIDYDNLLYFGILINIISIITFIIYRVTAGITKILC